MLQISDWHTDLDYKEGTVKSKCGSELCCQERFGRPADDSGARRFGEITGCDIPLETCREQLKWFAENLPKQPDLILWTGDSVSHDMAYMTREKVLQTLKLLTEIVKEVYPTTPVVVAIGNHDFEPANYQNFD